jgi:membrane associated rhomboid family serine protease
MSFSYGYGFGLPKAVKSLLIANAVLFVVTLFFPWRIWNYLFGLVPDLITHRFMIWQFFTYMFLHANFMHILFNMFALWMFGPELEYNWGSRDFLKYYITCGIGGGILVWLTALIGFSASSIPTIGASGAIFGILLAYGLMWPDRLILVFWVLPMKALHFVIIFGTIEILSGLSRSGGGTAYFAHVGGFVTGFIYLKFGWRMMVYWEYYMNKLKARKFTVVSGDRHDNPGKADYESHPDLDEEVDIILDKIAREGMDSLNEREQRILDRASRNKKR